MLKIEKKVAITIFFPSIINKLLIEYIYNYYYKRERHVVLWKKSHLKRQVL